MEGVVVGRGQGDGVFRVRGGIGPGEPVAEYGGEDGFAAALGADQGQGDFAAAAAAVAQRLSKAAEQTGFFREGEVLESRSRLLVEEVGDGVVGQESAGGGHSAEGGGREGPLPQAVALVEPLVEGGMGSGRQGGVRRRVVEDGGARQAADADRVAQGVEVFAAVLLTGISLISPGHDEKVGLEWKGVEGKGREGKGRVVISLR